MCHTISHCILVLLAEVVRIPSRSQGSKQCRSCNDIFFLW